MNTSRAVVLRLKSRAWMVVAPRISVPAPRLVTTVTINSVQTIWRSIIMRDLGNKYLILFGLYHLPHTLSLLGLYETIIDAPPILTIWQWHLVLLLVYGVAPLLVTKTGNRPLSSLLALACLIGAAAELLHVFEWSMCSETAYIILAVLDLIAFAVCLIKISNPFKNLVNS